MVADGKIYLTFFLLLVKQAKSETVDKVCAIVKKQLSLDETKKVTAETKFVDLGADSLDTVTHNLLMSNIHPILLPLSSNLVMNCLVYFGY